MPEIAQHQELSDIMNDLPAGLSDQPDLGGGGSGNDDDPNDEDEPINPGNDDEEDEPIDDIVPPAGDGNDDEEEDDDFVIGGDDEEEEIPAPPAAAATPKPAATNEGTYILNGLTKISVQIVAADDSVKTVEVYGFGDLPRDMKGFVSPYEQGVFQAAVTAQELRARELQTEYRQKATQQQTEQFQRVENRAIKDDLTDLRKEGLFPKFKGTPGTKEFNDSAGAKEFDRVIAYMNEQNDKYLQAHNSGKAYRHIGFREAYTMLNGPNPRAADQAADRQRRKIAGQLKTSRGTGADSRRPPARVTNITDLQSEFEQIVAG